MAKLSVKVTKGYPLWYAENSLYINTNTVEVEDSDWLQAQIAAGLVTTVEAEQPKKSGSRSRATKEEA